MFIAFLGSLRSSGRKPPDYYDTMLTLGNALEGRVNKAPLIRYLKRGLKGLLVCVLGFVLILLGKMMNSDSGVS